MTTKASQELVTGIGIVLLAALGYFIIIPFGIVVPEGEEIRALSPDFWPIIVVIVLFLAGLSIVIQALAGMRKMPGEKTRNTDRIMSCEENDDADQLPLKHAAFRVFSFIATLFLIYFAIPYIGMVGATIPAIVFLAWYAGEQRWKIIIPLAIILPLLLYFFFVYVANVPIPGGIFESLG